jgi:hypothetical protein
VPETEAVRMYYIVSPESGKDIPIKLVVFGDILKHVVKGITAKPVVPAGKTVVGEFKLMVNV